MSQISTLTAWHKAQLGVVETPKGSNNVKYNTQFYGRAVSGSQYPWCCAYIWCSFQDTKLASLFCGGAKTAYCPYVVQYAKAHKQWVTSGYREGDLILFDWDGDGTADHIGYCTGMSGNIVLTIEGNAADDVGTYRRYQSNIMGAYRPAYDEAPKTEVKTEAKPVAKVETKIESTPEILRRGSTGQRVKNAQALLFAHGYFTDAEDIDGEFGNRTYLATIKFQSDHGLEADGEIGPITLAALNS